MLERQAWQKRPKTSAALGSHWCLMGVVQTSWDCAAGEWRDWRSLAKLLDVARIHETWKTQMRGASNKSIPPQDWRCWKSCKDAYKNVCLENQRNGVWTLKHSNEQDQMHPDEKGGHDVQTLGFAVCPNSWLAKGQDVLNSALGMKASACFLYSRWNLWIAANRRKSNSPKKKCCLPAVFSFVCSDLFLICVQKWHESFFFLHAGRGGFLWGKMGFFSSKHKYGCDLFNKEDESDVMPLIHQFDFIFIPFGTNHNPLQHCHGLIANEIKNTIALNSLWILVERFFVCPLIHHSHCLILIFSITIIMNAAFSARSCAVVSIMKDRSVLASMKRNKKRWVTIFSEFLVERLVIDFQLFRRWTSARWLISLEFFDRLWTCIFSIAYLLLEFYFASVSGEGGGPWWWTRWMFLLLFGKCNWTWWCLLWFLWDFQPQEYQDVTSMVISSIQIWFELLLVSLLAILLNLSQVHCSTFLPLSSLTLQDFLLVFRFSLPRALQQIPRAWRRNTKLFLVKGDNLAGREGETVALQDLDHIVVDLPGIIDVIVTVVVVVAAIPRVNWMWIPFDFLLRITSLAILPKPTTFLLLVWWSGDCLVFLDNHFWVEFFHA